VNDDYPSDSDIGREGARFARWAIIAGALVLVVVLVLSAMAVFGFGLFQRGTAEFRGKTGQIERTKADPNFRIASYEHFYDLCVAVQADEGTISSLKEELTTKPSQNRVEQINASMTALRASRFEKISQYNADARKTDTQGNFRASDLPYQLSPNEESTTCTS
jgi:hypothetical protein